MQQGVFPAAAVLPRLRFPRRVGVQGQRQGDPGYLCDPPPQGGRLRATLRDCCGEACRRSAHDDQHRRMPADTGGAATRHAARGGVRKAERHHHASALPSGERVRPMPHNTVAVVGAAESTKLGVIPEMSQIQLHADAALNAMTDCGLKPKDIDGVATAGETPVQIAHYLGITPTWVDGTSVGGCSFMIHVRHAAAAIEAGLAKTILVTHGESGRSRVGAPPRPVPPSSLNGQFEQPFGPMGPPSMFTIPVLRYMKTYGVTVEQIAQVAVVQREWASKNPRATFRNLITTDDVLNSRMIAYPFRLLMCCLVTDGGGALILTSADRAKDFPTKPVYVLGTGESAETPLVSQMEDFTSSRAFRVAGPTAFKEAGIAHK